MTIHFYTAAVNLLGSIANSVHERDPKNPCPLCFTVSEVQLVEEWLRDFVKKEKPASGDT